MDTHRVGGNRKCNQQSTKADQKSIENVFLIAICCQWSDKWQSKTLFLLIFYLGSLIVLAFSIAAYPVWDKSLALHAHSFFFYNSLFAFSNSLFTI